MQKWRVIFVWLRCQTRLRHGLTLVNYFSSFRHLLQVHLIPKITHIRFSHRRQQRVPIIGLKVARAMELIIILCVSCRGPSAGYICNLAGLSILWSFSADCCFVVHWGWEEHAHLCIGYLLELLTWFHYATVVELHVWWPLRLIRRLHLNWCINFALQFWGTAKVTHGAAAEFASWWRNELLLVVMVFQIVFHTSASLTTSILHFISSFCTFEALDVKFLLNKVLNMLFLILINLILVCFVDKLRCGLIMAFQARVELILGILLYLYFLRCSVGGWLVSGARQTKLLRHLVVTTLIFALAGLHRKIHLIHQLAT